MSHALAKAQRTIKGDRPTPPKKLYGGILVSPCLSICYCIILFPSSLAGCI